MSDDDKAPEATTKKKKAKKKRAKAPPEVEREHDAEGPISEAIGQMSAMVKESGHAGGTAMIFRRGVGKAGRDKFLESVPILEVWNTTHEYIQERHGGGSYRITLKDEHGQFMKNVPHRLYYEIDGPPRAPGSEPDTRKLDELRDQLEARMGSGREMSTAELMRFMLEMTREQAREIRNPPAAAHGANPAEMAIALAESFQSTTGPVLTALLQRAMEPAPAPPPPPDPMSQLETFLGLMASMREMFQPAESKASGWDRVVDQVAAPLGDLLGQHVNNQRAGTAPPAAMLGNGAPRAATPNPPRDDMAGRPAWYPLLRTQLPQLLQWAAAGKNPEVMADFVAEMMPDNVMAMAYPHLSNPAFQDELVAHVPEAGAHREWFGAFVARLMEWYTMDDPPAAPESASPPEVGTVASGGDKG